MILTEREVQTKENYDEHCYEWLEVSGGRDRSGYWKEEMKIFMDYLGRGKKVIELGCGPATDGKYLLQAGCSKVLSTDYSKGMLKMAQDVLGGTELKPNLLQTDMYNLSFSDDSFDGFWATASMLHLEKPQRAVAEAKRILKPGGVGFISVKEGEGERVDSKTGYYFRYHSQSGPGSFEELLTESGFSILKSVLRPASPYNWLTYFVQKPII